MEGLPEVEKIMAPLSRHIKEGSDESNRQHYNYVYEAFMRVIEEKNCILMRLTNCCNVISKCLSECDYEDAGDGEKTYNLYSVPEDWLREALEIQDGE